MMTGLYQGVMYPFMIGLSNVYGAVYKLSPA